MYWIRSPASILHCWGSARYEITMAKGKLSAFRQAQ